MKKLFLLLTLLALLSQVVLSLDFCEDVFLEDVACSLVTPEISCTVYNYSIMNLSSVVEQGNLSLINQSVYHLVFNQSEGDYVVRLCDGSTREVYVESEDDPVWLAIIISLVGMTSLFGYIAFNIRSRRLVNIRIVMFLLTVVNAFMIGFVPVVMTLNRTDSSTFYPVALGYFSINALVLVLVLYFYGGYLISDVFRGTGDDRDE